MQYNEIYNICQPVMDWLKSNYPNHHKIVIDTNGAELIECGKLNVLDKDFKEAIFGKGFNVERNEEEIRNSARNYGEEMLKDIFGKRSEGGET